MSKTKHDQLLEEMSHAFTTALITWQPVQLTEHLTLMLGGNVKDAMKDDPDNPLYKGKEFNDEDFWVVDTSAVPVMFMVDPMDEADLEKLAKMVINKPVQIDLKQIDVFPGAEHEGTLVFFIPEGSDCEQMLNYVDGAERKYPHVEKVFVMDNDKPIVEQMLKTLSIPPGAMLQ